MNIIGITGRARSGKDTLANILSSQYGYQRLAFADPIREFVGELTGIAPYLLRDTPLKERPIPRLGGVTPREMMQTLGTEWGRNMVYPDIWVALCEQKIIEKMKYELRGFVIPDVRFDNEARMLRSLGGKIIHITRAVGEPVNSHVSEAGISPELVDLEIPNNGTLDDLRRRVQHAVFGGK